MTFECPRTFKGKNPESEEEDIYESDNGKEALEIGLAVMACPHFREIYI